VLDDLREIALKALRGPGENYSEVILRVAKGDAGKE
jgi:hypothetical protein